MTGAVESRYHGRDFTPGEMALLRALIAAEPPPTRHAPSREFCRRVGWLKPDGGLKDMMARVTMLAMHKDGLIALPPPKWRQNRPAPIVFGPDTEPPLFPPPTTLDEVRPLDLRPVVRGTRAGKLWNEFVARYHYLGYKTLVGARMRYAVHDRDGGPIAMLGFSTAAWKLAPRDNFIGWTPQLREKNLPLVVDNPRFLILPWIEIPNLGSHLLAIVRRRLPVDWAERYNTKPVLIETFVETPRYTGAVYRASGWVHVGTTRGRGRYDWQRQFDKPRKRNYILGYTNAPIPARRGGIPRRKGRGDNRSGRFALLHGGFIGPPPVEGSASHAFGAFWVDARPILRTDELRAGVVGTILNPMPLGIALFPAIERLFHRPAVFRQFHVFAFHC